jgi:hypothetical protein
MAGFGSLAAKIYAKFIEKFTRIGYNVTINIFEKFLGKEANTPCCSFPVKKVRVW